MPDENMSREALSQVKTAFDTLNKSNDKKVHLNALVKISEQMEHINSNELCLLIDEMHTYILPCFKAESDKCREIAIDIATEAIKSGKCNNMVLLLVFQNLENRLASAEFVEKTEEVRLKLIQLLRQIITIYGRINCFSGYLDSIIRILNNTLRDDYSSVIEESCKCICQLAECLQLDFHTKAAQLLKQTLEALKHQQSRIRIEAIFATGALILHTSEFAKDAMAFFFDLLFDEKENVRKTVYIVVSRLLLICRDRSSFEHYLVLLLLSGLNDSFEKNRQEAEKRWEQIGIEFLNSDRNVFDTYRDYKNEYTTVHPYPTYKPNKGCKLLVKEHLELIIAQVTENLDCWKSEQQIMSANLLKVVIVHAESSVAKYMSELFRVIVQVFNSKNQELLTHLIEIVQRIARAVDVPHWIESIEHIFLKQQPFSCQKYPVFATLISYSDHKSIIKYLNDLLPIFRQKFVCDTDCLKLKNSQYSCQESILSCFDKMPPLLNIEENDLETIYELVFIKTAELKLSGNNYDYGLKVMNTIAVNLGMTVDEFHDKYLRVIFANWLKRKKIIWAERTIEILLLEMVLVNTKFLNSTNYYKDVLENLHEMLSDNRSQNTCFKVDFLMILSKIFASNEKNITFDIESNKFVDLFLTGLVKDCMQPGLQWTPGKSSEKIRSAFIVCHTSLMRLLVKRRKTRLPEPFVSLLKQTDKQMISFLNEQLESSRKNVLVYLQFYIRLMADHDTEIGFDFVQRVFEAIKLHFDDDKDSVRVEAFKTIQYLFNVQKESLQFSSLQSSPSSAPSSYQIKQILETTILYFDDLDFAVQKASYDCVQSILHVYPTICIDFIKSIKNNLKNQDKCDRLIQSFSS